MNNSAASDDVLSFFLSNIQSAATEEEKRYLSDLSLYLQTKKGKDYLKLQIEIFKSSQTSEDDVYGRLTDQRANLYPEREAMKDIDVLLDLVQKSLVGLEEKVVEVSMKKSECRAAFKHIINSQANSKGKL